MKNYKNYWQIKCLITKLDGQEILSDYDKQYFKQGAILSAFRQLVSKILDEDPKKKEKLLEAMRYESIQDEKTGHLYFIDFIQQNKNKDFAVNIYNNKLKN